ncbi:hypothetical protein [Azospirillum tabaci]|uniref:hypothetical protein n=1 Tax=Azospirillum tabaci TaxID=2752310 RepID=UPI001660887D|nr:hypothetical protein [Azospirillum tabaci]
MRSTMIPSIGLTFAGAAQRIADLARDGLHHEYAPLEDKMLAAQPVTPLDVLAVLDRLLCPEIGLAGEGHRHAPALQRVRDALDTLLAGSEDADHGPFLADVRRWLKLEATIGAEGQDDADLIDSSEEAFRLAMQIATYDGNPTLAMAAKAILLWAGHPVACHPDSKPGALPFPPPVSAARKEDDALIFGLVADALRAVPELQVMLTSEAAVATESDDFGAAIASLADRAIPRTAPAVPTVITDAMVEAGATAAGCSPDAFRAGMTAALKMMEAA